MKTKSMLVVALITIASSSVFASEAGDQKTQEGNHTSGSAVCNNSGAGSGRSFDLLSNSKNAVSYTSGKTVKGRQ